jgi:hypothetical protein
VLISGKPEISGEREKKQTAKRQRPVFSDVGASSFPFSFLGKIPRERSAVRRTVKSIRTAAERPCQPLGAGGVRDDIVGEQCRQTHAPNGAPLAAILGLGSVLPGAESGLLPR